MDRIRSSKPVSIAVITFIYVLAAVIGITVCISLPFNLWLNLLLSDIAATIFVFIFSFIFRNASVYDPYWSVQPVVITLCCAFHCGFSPATVIVLVSIVYWGIRLTGNWAYVFDGLNHQDWRYTKLEKENGRLYPLINLAGIHMMPTLIVYACTLPAVYLISEGGDINAGSIIGGSVSVCAATLQLAADIQMHRYRKRGEHGLIRTGLWKYSRHPNYLGEILMWWGIAIQSVSVIHFKWWIFIGALLNTVLFFTVSIPLADRRQSAKPGYAEYRKQTHSLLPVPKKI